MGHDPWVVVVVESEGGPSGTVFFSAWVPFHRVIPQVGDTVVLADIGVHVVERVIEDDEHQTIKLFVEYTGADELEKKRFAMKLVDRYRLSAPPRRP